jgi:hypothetical protein
MFELNGWSDASGAGLGLNEEPAQALAAKAPTESGEQRPAARPQRGAGHLAAEHGHFMAEHHDLNREFAFLRAEELEQLGGFGRTPRRERTMPSPSFDVTFMRRKSS